jgi:outer membrane protein TolC
MLSFFGRQPGSLILFLVALSVWATPVAAASRAPLTLAEAEDLAMQAEPGREALEARAAGLREQAIVAGALPDPMLRVGLNNFPVQSGGFSTEAMTQASIGVRQTFPAGKTRVFSAEKFGRLADGMSERAAARSRDVRTAVREAWLDLFYLDQSRALVVESRPYFADLADVTRSLYAVGRKTQQDVLRAELELSRLDDRVIDIERRRAHARAALAEWIGDAAERPLAAALPGWESVPAIEMLQEGLQRHPALLAADAEVLASEAGIRIADERSKPGWALDLAYGYREGFLPSGQPRSDMVTLGVTFDLPFFRKKSVDSTLTAALQERTAANAAKRRLQRELRRELETAFIQWRDLTRRLSVFDGRILGQAEDHADAALLAYRSDAGDFADVMRAYVDLLNTRIDRIRLQVERAQSYAVLVNLGGLTP